MKYCIGEFASILGVTADTLRLYEKHDIVRPTKDNSNNYRYFNDLDARDLLMSRWYRSMGIPLPEVATLMKESSLEQVMGRMQETESNLEEEIKRKTMLLKKMNEIHNELRELDSSLYKCKLKQLPGMYRLKQTDKNALLKNDIVKSLVNTWMDLLPYAFYSFRIEDTGIFFSENNNFNYSWGLTLLEDEAQQFEMDIEEYAEYISPSLCISATMLCTDEKYITKNSLQFMFDYIEANHYSISGDVVGKLLLTEKIEGHNRSYLEVNIPIK
ncbi:MerR family transcriptional regulator [Paenibacillus sp. FSL R5-0345]|uniref:MerR family transcriptional regulator n=1 Tax=unclassified Paenibacillus TaxID=185978 RepID=UPI0004F817AE|nr:MerR family transcriptional regulator [Paenibacillus sp. FSL R5-0345]AIQ34939.1 MerR family transcriptional regulator [Paenibacillus sp. FSL R5-0345]